MSVCHIFTQHVGGQCLVCYRRGVGGTNAPTMSLLVGVALSPRLVTNRTYTIYMSRADSQTCRCVTFSPNMCEVSVWFVTGGELEAQMHQPCHSWLVWLS